MDRTEPKVRMRVTLEQVDHMEAEVLVMTMPLGLTQEAAEAAEEVEVEAMLPDMELEAESKEALVQEVQVLMDLPVLEEEQALMAEKPLEAS